MTDRLAELGALAYAAENAATASTSPNRLGGAGYLHAAYAEYQTWAAANPNTNPSRLSAKGRLFGYFYDNASWSPSSLFAAGEQGVWYDPSDFSTMFQDAAGTTPVTAVEQPVGLVLDKSKGLVLGAELATTFTALRSSVTNPSEFPTVVSNVGGLSPFGIKGTNLTAGKRYKIEVSYSGSTVTNNTLQIDAGAESVVDVAVGPSGTLSAVVYISAGTDWYIYSNSTGGGFTIDSATIREIHGNHASQSTTTKRAILRQDANGKYYLAFDGTDDSLATASIDFSATDKMAIFAGVRKNNDTPGIVFELSAGTAGYPGTFYGVSGEDDSQTGYHGLARGSAAIHANQRCYYNVSGVDTSVVTFEHDIAGNLSSIRRNGAVGTNGTGDKGAGNFGNYPLYIGQRAGTTLTLNGRIYSLIVLGRTATAAEITSTEAWVANKTGVTL